MKKLLPICIFSLVVLSVACNKSQVSGSGSILSEERNVNNFTKVHATGSTDVHIIQGAIFKVEVKGYETLLPYFETKLNGNTLQLGYKSNINVKNDNIKVFITLPILNSISISGSGNISTTGNFTGNVNFETHVSGSGDITVSTGTAQHYISTISGSGNINAFGLQSEEADISISGSGDTEVNATAKLKVNISGSGNVYYKNTPAIDAKISGSGAVIPK